MASMSLGLPSGVMLLPCQKNAFLAADDIGCHKGEVAIEVTGGERGSSVELAARWP